MDPRDFFRGFFGFQNPHHSNEDPRFYEENVPRVEDEEEDPLRRRSSSPLGEDNHFHVFTNPLEMQKFFDSQLDEILKNFFHGFGGGNRPWTMIEPPPNNGGRRSWPPMGEEEEEGGARDFMLKTEEEEDGFLSPPSSKVDSEVDSLSPDDLNRLFPFPKSREGSSRRQIQPFDFFFGNQKLHREEGGSHFRSGFFGQSVVEQTIKRSDGSVETRRTERSSDGREVTTITVTDPITGKKKEVTTTEKRPEFEKNSPRSNTESAIFGHFREDLIKPYDKEYRTLFSKFFG